MVEDLYTLMVGYFMVYTCLGIKPLILSYLYLVGYNNVVIKNPELTRPRVKNKNPHSDYRASEKCSPAFRVAVDLVVRVGFEPTLSLPFI